ncbi:hypothetical protein CC86DRAFT_366971 [Ophiobolus disseminans]|uniref:Uncharacterized protein n=1 Tax=Ophiobolus disseminans TaxID=1469910 RepID=A0A6A7AGE4_9PLEO|nr:hypothetical protein CC86DRAFT_366971 [Ophiobolus disseminans]
MDQCSTPICAVVEADLESALRENITKMPSQTRPSPDSPTNVRQSIRQRSMILKPCAQAPFPHVADEARVSSLGWLKPEGPTQRAHDHP